MNNPKDSESILDTNQNEISIQTYKTLFKKLTVGFALCEVICDDKDNPIDYRFKFLNPAFEKQSGIKFI